MSLSVAQDNKNHFRNAHLFVSKNNTSFVIPFNCPLTMAFLGGCIPGRLAWTAIAKDTHIGQIQAMSLASGSGICYYSIFSCRDININRKKIYSQWQKGKENWWVTSKGVRGMIRKQSPSTVCSRVPTRESEVSKRWEESWQKQLLSRTMTEQPF